MTKIPANPTESDMYTVLWHPGDGRMEVWDCEAFGPWSLAAGPYYGETAYAEACAAYQAILDESGAA